ncbi:MAG: hypothetical protein MUO24_01935 [Desulfobacterales bacterium]|nr:hypothetical protein [Desulfobacterales bacterium]
MMHRILISSLFLLWVSLAVAADFSYENIKLGSNIKSIPRNDYKCAPSPLLPDEKQCNKNQTGPFMGVSAKKVELWFEKDRLHIIFIGLSPDDVATVRKALEQKYGKPKSDKQLLKGVFQTTWQKGDTELVLNKDSKRGTADVTMIDYRKK